MKFQLALSFLLFSEVCGRVQKQKKKTDKFLKRNFSHEKVLSLSDEFDKPKRITNREAYNAGDGSCLENARRYSDIGNLYATARDDACSSETTDARIGVGSCTMARACWCTSRFTTIGDGSCTSSMSCQEATDDMEARTYDNRRTIGNGSCTGHKSCYHINANVGNDACTENYINNYYRPEERQHGCHGYKGFCGDVPAECPSIAAWRAGTCSIPWCTPDGSCVGTTPCNSGTACTSTQPGTEIGAGSCAGDFSCNGVGSTYTPELDAIGGDGFVTIGSHSCIGTRSCFRVQSDIGPNSCDGELSCQFCSGDVAEDSCHGYKSCRGIGAAIGAGSCLGEKSCYERRESSGTVGAGSCIGVESCDADGVTAQSIGTGSCLGEKSCKEVSVSVGHNSCTAQESCKEYSGAQGPIPDNCPSKAELEAGNC